MTRDAKGDDFLKVEKHHSGARDAPVKQHDEVTRRKEISPAPSSVYCRQTTMSNVPRSTKVDIEPF